MPVWPSAHPIPFGLSSLGSESIIVMNTKLIFWGEGEYGEIFELRRSAVAICIAYAHTVTRFGHFDTEV